MVLGAEVTQGFHFLQTRNTVVPVRLIFWLVLKLSILLYLQLVNRHKSAKKKAPVALTEDMLNELNKNHMGGLDNYGADDLYNMEDVWNDKPPKKVIFMINQFIKT